MTHERPAPGVVVTQPCRGFRYGSESFWLAGFALEGGTFRSAVDLGTGSGIVAFLLASRGIDTVGYDVREEWAPCWAHSLNQSAVPGRIALRVRDIALGVPDRVDVVVTNPPFFPLGSGPAATDPWKAAARTESSATLARFVEVGLQAGERLCAVVPIERIDEVSRAGVAAGASVRRVVTVGRRRGLVELGPARSATERAALTEDAPRVRGWYARVAAPSGVEY